MKNTEIEIGDHIRPLGSLDTFIVTSIDRGVLTAVRQIITADPSTWELVQKGVKAHASSGPETSEELGPVS